MSYQYLQTQTLGSGDSDLTIINNSTTEKNLKITNESGGTTSIGNDSLSSLEFGVSGLDTDVVLTIATITGASGQVLTANGDGSCSWQTGTGGGGVTIQNNTVDASQPILFNPSLGVTSTLQSSNLLLYNPSNATLTNDETGTIINATYQSQYAIDMNFNTGGANINLTADGNINLNAASNSLTVTTQGSSGSSGQFLGSDGSGNVSWQSGSGGGVTINNDATDAAQPILFNPSTGATSTLLSSSKLTYNPSTGTLLYNSLASTEVKSEADIVLTIRTEDANLDLIAGGNLDINAGSNSVSLTTQGSYGLSGQFLGSDGLGNVAWGNPSYFVNPYPNLSVPIIAFNYFVSTNNSGQAWSNSDSINGSPYSTVTDGQDFGTMNFSIDPSQLGTYRFGVCYTTGDNLGIINIICDSVTTSIDMYSGGTNNNVGYQWEQTFSTAGAKTIQVINNGKNSSSSDYQVIWNYGEISIYRIS
jgi:hypothetical protein